MPISDQDFHRIKRLPPYVFEQVNKLKAQARARGEDIIDFGMGNPDLPTPAHITEKLVETIAKPRTNRYSASKGIPGLRRAQAAYYERRFGVKLNPDTQVVATLGSKEGFANMAQAITAPGDVILSPNPTYPIHEFGFIISGGVIRSIPATPDEEMMRALDRAMKHSIPKPLALVISYPSNPTALIADLDFYKRGCGYKGPFLSGQRVARHVVSQHCDVIGERMSHGLERRPCWRASHLSYDFGRRAHHVRHPELYGVTSAIGRYQLLDMSNKILRRRWTAVVDNKRWLV